MPKDNEETMEATIQLALELDPDLANFMLAAPFPGTKMWDMIQEGGEVFAHEWPDYAIHEQKARFVMHDGEYDPDLVVKKWREAYRRFYLYRPKRVWEKVSQEELLAGSAQHRRQRPPFLHRQPGSERRQEAGPCRAGDQRGRADRSHVMETMDDGVRSIVHCPPPLSRRLPLCHHAPSRPAARNADPACGRPPQHRPDHRRSVAASSLCPAHPTGVWRSGDRLVRVVAAGPPPGNTGRDSERDQGCAPAFGAADLGTTTAAGDVSTRLRRRWHARRDQRRLHAYFAAQQRAEQALFAAEVAELADFAAVQPQRIHPADVNGAPFIAQMQALSPFFLLTLGGPLYKPALLATVRGVALNQHAGHSPDLRGSNTTEWALYHRDLDRVSATIHLTTSGADAGPILRRSQPCLFPDDDPNTIFARVVALGTELLIESVRQIMAGEPVRVFPQPPHSGRTHLGQELNAILAPIQRDFAADWLPAELQRQRQF